MELLTSILTFIGFFAVTFGLAGTITKWIKAAEERKLTAADNHREITTSLKRIEETLRHHKP
jgi:hypothetical protein